MVMQQHSQQHAPTDAAREVERTPVQSHAELSGVHFRELADADLHLVIAGTIHQPEYPNLQRGLRYVLKPVESSTEGEVFVASGPVRPSRCYALSFSGTVNNRRETMYSDVFEAGYSLRLIAFVARDSFDIWSGGKRIGSFVLGDTPQTQSDVTASVRQGEGSGLDALIRTIDSDRPYVRRYLHAELQGSIRFYADCPRAELAGLSVNATLSGVGVASNVRLPIQDATKEKPGHREIRSPLCLSQVHLLSCDAENPQPVASILADSAFLHPDLTIYNRPLGGKLANLISC